MFTIPLPFSIALILILSVILFFRTLSYTQIIFFISMAGLELILGIRWAWNFWQISWLQTLHILIQSPIPALAWLSYLPAKRKSWKNWLHILGPLVFILSGITFIFGPLSIDITMTLLSAIYGLAMLYVAIFQKYSRVTDINSKTFQQYRPMLLTCGSLFIATTVINILLSLNILLTNGQQIIQILAIGHWLLLIPFIILVFLTGKQAKSASSASCYPRKIIDTSSPKNKPCNTSYSIELKSVDSLPSNLQSESINTNKMSSLEQLIILNKIEQLINEGELYLNPDLTLKRLAQKIGIPTRQITEVVNQQTGQNVSQFINQYRIEYAKKQLIESNKTITEIFMDAGFHTKSNFNREFLRITKQTPSDYRRSHETETNS